MKINEVTTKQLDEGPIDAIKQVGAGLKGAYQGFKAGGIGAGAKAGWQAQGAANTQADMIKSVTTKALQDWAKVNQSLKMGQQEITTQDVVDWFTNFSGVAPVGQPPGITPAQVQPWIQKQIGIYIAKKTLPGNAPKQPQAGVAGGADFPPDLSGYTPQQLKQLKQLVQQSLKAA